MKAGWLYRLPPWRMPRIRRHHYHHGHHTETTPIARWLGVAAVFAFAWWMELLVWAGVWCYYALFLGARWVWRHNPIGQTIDSATAARERGTVEPPREHIDLGRLGR